MDQGINLDPAMVAAAIRRRKTLKVLGDEQDQAVVTPEVAERNQPLVLDALQTAGWAPFHFSRGEDDMPEPWRAHVLWHPTCRELAPKLFEWFPNLNMSSKLPKMLQACGALVLVTWLPQFYDREDRNPSQINRDEEHLAAAAAMVQNLLLILTSHGMGTYWSSGGKLRSQTFFEHMGIPSKERLLAAVFVEYPELAEQPRQRVAGKNRDLRTNRWIREISDWAR